MVHGVHSTRHRLRQRCGEHQAYPRAAIAIEKALVLGFPCDPVRARSIESPRPVYYERIFVLIKKMYVFHSAVYSNLSLAGSGGKSDGPNSSVVFIATHKLQLHGDEFD